jgi:hypothetical protein
VTRLEDKCGNGLKVNTDFVEVQKNSEQLESYLDDLRNELRGPAGVFQAENESLRGPSGDFFAAVHYVE